MSTILRFQGYRIVIYSNDHQPPHVHVIGPDTEAIFQLNCPDGPPLAVRCYQLSLSALNLIQDHLHTHIHLLCRHWRHIHETV